VGFEPETSWLLVRDPSHYSNAAPSAWRPENRSKVSSHWVEWNSRSRLWRLWRRWQHCWTTCDHKSTHSSAKNTYWVLPVGLERGGGIRLFEGNWNWGRRGGCTILNSTIVIYVRTLFMFRRTRHSVNTVKTGENVPKFYKLVFNPNYHPIF
jgi:hypothetical protein